MEKKQYYIAFVRFDTPLEEGDMFRSKFRTENKQYHFVKYEANRETYFGFSIVEDFMYKVELRLVTRKPGWNIVTNEEEVICMVSPEATWLDHGQTYSEDDVDIRTQVFKDDKWVTIPELWLSKDIPAWPQRKVAFIRNSSCKHFH